MNTNETNKYFLPTAVIVAGLLIAGAVMWYLSGNSILGTTPNAMSAADRVAADVIANASMYKAIIDSNMAEAKKAGIIGIPSFVIDDTAVLGAFPFSRYQTIIDAVLAGKTTSDKSSKINIRNVKINGNPFTGKANAPVVIAFWCDFMSSYCKEFEVGGAFNVGSVQQMSTPTVLPDIIKDYVDTGKVKIVFMDSAFLGADTITASLYSQSIWRLYPDEYFAWRKAMYIAQGLENIGFGNAESIDKINSTVLDKPLSEVPTDPITTQ